MKTAQKKYAILNTETGRVNRWPLSKILENINRDRSDEWTDYDETDWQEGLEEFTEFTLIKG